MLAARFVIGVSLVGAVMLATACGKIAGDDREDERVPPGTVNGTNNDPPRFETSCAVDTDCIVVIACGCKLEAFSRASGARNKTNEECGIPAGAAGKPCAGALPVCNAGTCETCAYGSPRCTPAQPPVKDPPPPPPPPPPETPDG